MRRKIHAAFEPSSATTGCLPIHRRGGGFSLINFAQSPASAVDSAPMTVRVSISVVSSCRASMAKVTPEPSSKPPIPAAPMIAARQAEMRLGRSRGT